MCFFRAGVHLYYSSGFGELGYIDTDGTHKTVLYIAPGPAESLFNIAKYGDLVFVHEDLFNTEFGDFALSIVSIPDKSLVQQRMSFETVSGEEHFFWHTDRFRVRLPRKLKLSAPRIISKNMRRKKKKLLSILKFGFHFNFKTGKIHNN